MLREHVNRFIENIRKETVNIGNVHDLQENSPELQSSAVEERATLDHEPDINIEETLILVNGDGNCYFRCISYGLYGTEDSHKEIR